MYTLGSFYSVLFILGNVFIGVKYSKNILFCCVINVKKKLIDLLKEE